MEASPNQAAMYPSPKTLTKGLVTEKKDSYILFHLIHVISFW
jgi:hypothetical protein